MNKLYILLTLIIFSTLQAQEYRLGRGYEVYSNETLSLNVGGHLDTYIHTSSEMNSSVGINQAGLILSGEITPSFRFLGEAGSDDIYDYDVESTSSQSTDIQLMRLYGEYTFSDAFSLKAGQFLTPIGIWNRTYIPALRWSAFTPYVASGFFPKLIVGASANGRLLLDKSLSYSLFYHADGEYDTNKNNVPAKEFVGGEVRYNFGFRSKIALPFGRYKSESKKEICLFTGLNFTLPFNKNELSSEFIYKDGEWKDAKGNESDWKDYAWYLQYVQHVYKSSFVSARFGQKKRFDSKAVKNWEDNNIVLSYIYRPKTALSIKAEYRHRERSGTKVIQSDESLLSFSVLF